ncbi:MAG: hypothetical protein K940chlam9_01059 [Chlamydiae bacterium]|nr:hypothetical protein [Chlamydiota bacterium]
MISSLGIGFRLKARVVIDPDRRWMRNTRNVVMVVGILAIAAGVALLAGRGIHLHAFHSISSLSPVWGRAMIGAGGALLLGALAHRFLRMVSDYWEVHKHEDQVERMLTGLNGAKEDYHLKIVSASKGILVVADRKNRTVRVVRRKEWESLKIRLQNKDFYAGVTAVKEKYLDPFVRPSTKSAAKSTYSGGYKNVRQVGEIN